jgi:hypothetical protein
MVGLQISDTYDSFSRGLSDVLTKYMVIVGVNLIRSEATLEALGKF